MKKLIDCFFLFSYNSMERQKILNPLTGRMVYADGVVAKSIPKMKKSVGVLEGAVKRTGTTKIAEKKEAVGKLSGAIKRTLAKKPEPKKVYGWEDLPDDIKDKISDNIIISRDGKDIHNPMDINHWKYNYRARNKDLFMFAGKGYNGYGNKNIYWNNLISYLDGKIKKEEHDLIIKLQDYIIKYHEAEKPPENWAGNSLYERLSVPAVPYSSTERAYRLYGMDEDELKRWGGVQNCPLICLDFSADVWTLKKGRKRMTERSLTQVLVWLRGDDVYNLKDVLPLSERMSDYLIKSRVALLPDGYSFGLFSTDFEEDKKNMLYNAFLFNNHYYPIDKLEVCRKLTNPSGNAFADFVKRGLGHFPEYRMIKPTEKQVERYLQNNPNITDYALKDMDIYNKPITLAY